MNDIAVFTYTDVEVRTVLIDSQPWFVIADVCRVLALTNPTMVADRLDEDDLSTAEVIDNLGRTQTVRVTNTAGVYQLVFMSRKPEAKAFKRWVTHDVLPAIQQTGRYEAPTAAVALPDRRALALMVIEAEDRADRAEAELAVIAPKADSWDVLANAQGDWSVADAAKVLSRDPNIKVGRDRLFTWMAAAGWIHRGRADNRWRVYQSQIETGRLSELASSHYHPRTGELVLDPPQVRITTKGLHELHRRLGGARLELTA